jgi:hypothetical protein
LTQGVCEASPKAPRNAPSAFPSTGPSAGLSSSWTDCSALPSHLEGWLSTARSSSGRPAPARNGGHAWLRRCLRDDFANQPPGHAARESNPMKPEAEPAASGLLRKSSTRWIREASCQPVARAVARFPWLDGRAPGAPPDLPPMSSAPIWR